MTISNTTVPIEVELLFPEEEPVISSPSPAMTRPPTLRAPSQPEPPIAEVEAPLPVIEAAPPVMPEPESAIEEPGDPPTANSITAASIDESDRMLRAYREKLGARLQAAIQGRFRREARRSDEGTVRLTVRADARTLELVSAESKIPLLARIVRESFSGLTPPPFPEELGAPLLFNFRFRFELR